MRLVARTAGRAEIAHRFIIEKLSAYAVPAWHTVENEAIQCTLPSVRNAGCVTMKSERNTIYFVFTPAAGQATREVEALVYAAVFKMVISHFGDQVSQLCWCGEGA
jgi:hypothetical protein